MALQSADGAAFSVSYNYSTIKVQFMLFGSFTYEMNIVGTRLESPARNLQDVHPFSFQVNHSVSHQVLHRCNQPCESYMILIIWARNIIDLHGY